jgi:hypothetical protein
LSLIVLARSVSVSLSKSCGFLTGTVALPTGGRCGVRCDGSGPKGLAPRVVECRHAPQSEACCRTRLRPGRPTVPASPAET